jgi:2',3'-cyclic-nucleotide 2'-phosphodiesterase (5'-nucleotidase family)
LLGETIGVTQVALDSNRKSVRSEENAFANLMTDAIRSHAGAEIALINSGNIRGEKQYPAGTTLTRRDIAMELPYRNQVVLLSITGQQLLLALENSFSELELLRGRFAHVSGMQIRFDSTKAVGQRVVDVRIQGNKLEPTRVYKLATFDYMANGGDGYTMLMELPQHTYPNQMNKLVSEIVVDFIKQQATIAPVLEERMVDVGRRDP